MHKFPSHRSVTPMLWAFVSLALCELLAVHLLMASLWPVLAWPLTILTLVSVVWLIFWIRSWQRLPHELHSDKLILHMGSLRSIEVPLAAIAKIDAEVTGAKLKAAGIRNLVPVAFPNRLILLSAPLEERRLTNGVAIKLDDPSPFDAALAPILLKQQD